MIAVRNQRIAKFQLHWRLYSILASICTTFMVWPGANNQLDYNTVPDIQMYELCPIQWNGEN
jgi:hypothetical protein